VGKVGGLTESAKNKKALPAVTAARAIPKNRLRHKNTIVRSWITSNFVIFFQKNESNDALWHIARFYSRSGKIF
jgi:hypothetical protein